MQPPKPTRARAGLICLLLLLAGLGGCGSGADTSPAADQGGDPAKTQARPTGPAISRSECQALRRELEDRGSSPAQIETESSPPSSSCEVRGRGLSVSIVLDAAEGARWRYFDWVAGLRQDNAGDPTTVPHPVAGVGERAAGRSTAGWVPAFGTLYVLRDNRWVTVTYLKTGSSQSRQKARAIELAERVYRLGR